MSRSAPSMVKTLAQPAHRSDAMPSVRLARNDNGDGNVIFDLLTAAGWDLTGVVVDPKDLYPYWLVAEQAGRVVGCIQVAISKPIGYMELLAVEKTLPAAQQAVLVKALCYAAMGTLKRAGATLAGGTVSFEDKSWKTILKRRGCVVIGSGNRLLKRLV